MQKSSKSEILLLITAFIWGTGFIATKMAVNSGLEVLPLLTIRFGISSVILYFILKKEKLSISKKDLKAGIIVGLALSLGYITQTFGAIYTTPSKNALFTGLNVIFIPYLSYMFFKHKVSKYSIVASFGAFIGAYILIGDFSGGLDTINIGDVFSILCALCFALHVIFIERYMNDMEIIKLAFIQIFVATIINGILSIPYGSYSNVNLFNMGLVIYLAVFCTCICYILQILAQKNISASRTAILLSMEVVFGTILSILLGFEKFHINILIGTIMIFISIIISETKLSFLFKGEKNE